MAHLHGICHGNCALRYFWGVLEIRNLDFRGLKGQFDVKKDNVRLLIAKIGHYRPHHHHFSTSVETTDCTKLFQTSRSSIAALSSSGLRPASQQMTFGNVSLRPLLPSACGIQRIKEDCYWKHADRGLQTVLFVAWLRSMLILRTHIFVSRLDVFSTKDSGPSSVIWCSNNQVFSPNELEGPGFWPIK